MAMSRVKLGDVAVEHKETCKGNKDGYPVVGLEHLTPEEVSLTNWDENSDNTFTKMFRKGNVLFGRRRAYLKKAAVAPFDGICSGDITVIEAIPDRVFPDLLPFIIQNDDLFTYAIGKSAGSLSPRVKWEYLKDYEFELPDMDRQKELSEILWAMDTAKKSYQKLIAATDELVKSQFIEMFGKRDGAIYFTLEECCVSVTGGSTPSMKHEEYFGGEVPFIKSGDVKADYVSSGALWLTQMALEETTAKYVPAGTVVVVTRSGILKHNLPVAITSNPVVINQDLKAFEPKSEFSPQYIAWAIRSREDELLGKTRVMTVDNIESKDLYEIPVMIASREDQEQFAAFVRQSDKSKFAALKCSNLNLSLCLASPKTVRMQ